MYPINNKKLKYHEYTECMSSVRIKPFANLSNFQQWVILYLIQNKKMNLRVEAEIINFCDTTKQNIDLNNFEKNMEELQGELVYLAQMKLIESDGQGYYIFSTKGKLYCYQNLEQNLAKLATNAIKNKIIASTFYRDSRNLCDRIIARHDDLKSVAILVIGDKKTAMANIIIFAQLVVLLLSL